uniref:Uncharacterized protein n=1 Tax=Candidatus Kentrum sp. FM TaxID=2126340 RepID=A0A450TXY9_9GAMM|nr:MAG: hypothetical protein BECKFM1743C_GA0114222_107782 [Candidatus Kentron sp. FM]VFJ75223.1 MAG: hypothetical protein BECKFM1743A_GA0114220_108181 [Candidatus Kentron sp. FM]VFK10895.1 MAG: hypothetical protein BECKFM1743B_GA0114221_101592 [Candidatus Kentron sp. FM]
MQQVLDFIGDAPTCLSDQSDAAHPAGFTIMTINTQTVVDDRLVTALPALRPLLGRRVRMSALEISDSANPTTKRISFDEFLAFRLKRPDDMESVSLEAMEQAIIEGATGGKP